jgi:hypothetical protein
MKERNAKRSKIQKFSLDPTQASVAFGYEDLGGGCHGRVYYWYDPQGRLGAIVDQEFRTWHPEVHRSGMGSPVL